MKHTTDIADAANPAERNLLYQKGELLYGGIATRAFSKGWTVLPQERGDKRITSKIDGRALKWGQYIDAPPPAKEVEYWARQAPRANGAILMGKPSGNVFCFDIDVMDEELSYAIQELATKILGKTRFSRVGRAPKAALFYRVENDEDLPKNRALRFDGSDDMLEVQARGKVITGYGYHHSTGKYFIWRGPQPTTHSPEAVPVVTPEQIESFIDAVAALRPFSTKTGGAAVEIIEGDGSLEVSAEGWTIPRIRRDDTVVEHGLIVGGREGWLRDLTFNLVRLNPGLASASPSTAVAVAFTHAEKHMKLSGRDVRGDIAEKISRAVGSLRRGEIRNLPTVRERADGTRETNRRGVLPGSGDADLWHLPAPDKRRPVELVSRSKPDADKAAERAIIEDRTPIADAVASGVDAALAAFFDEVYSMAPMGKTAHVLKVPTGGGKTTRTISYIAHDPRTFTDIDANEGDDGEGRSGPVLFLMPTYNNIEELRERADIAALDPDASDDVLAAQAAAAGIMSVEDAEREIERLREEAKGTGLRALTYKGKIASGCQFEERVRQLQDAGISTAGMCKARRRDATTGETNDVYCQYYATCEAILQKAKIAASHVVFLPHAFLNLSIPEELKNVRAVIIDERVFPLVMHTSQMKLSTLELQRREPHLTKKEREIVCEGKVGRKAQDDAILSYQTAFLHDRRDAAEVAIEALREGNCPAGALAAFEHPGGKLTGIDLVRSALRVCGSASTSNVSIFPGMDDETFKDLVTRPTGTEVKTEYRFWKIIEDRIESLENESHKQSREQRLQLRHDTVEEKFIDDDGVERTELKTSEFVRLSWRTELNWPSAPLLLLDASADERITAKAFPDRAVVLHEIDAPLNLKTVLVTDRRRSTRSLTPDADIESQDALAAARGVEQIRAVENALAARHANGRMVVGMTKKVRQLSRKEYLAPANVDDLHYGAERGLNFAEQHVAALAVGRLEMPVWILDGLAAALGYDDEDELMLLDPLGTGKDRDGNPLKPGVANLTIPMRDGSDVVIESAMAPEGTWQRAVQLQFREESIRQFAGRLRPVYRIDTPILYIVSQVLPAGFVVDDIVSTADLIPSYAPLIDAARHTDGILDHVRCHDARPDLASKDKYRDLFASLPEQLKAGYWAIQYRVGESIRIAGVPAHHGNPTRVLEDLLERQCIAYSDIEILRAPANPRRAPADTRPSDEIEVALGSREDRYASECAALDRAVEWMGARHRNDTRRPQYLPGGGSYVVGMDKDSRPIRLGLNAIALLTRPKDEKKDAPDLVAANDDHEIAI